jgi:hypothetical protein
MRWLLVLFVIGFAAAMAKADTAVDPRITIGGGGSCESFSLNSLTQSFTGLQTGCLIDFTNNIGGEDEEGTTLTQIVVNVTSPFEGPLTCDPTGAGSPFNNGVTSSPTSCTFNNVTILLASFLDTQSGVGPGGVFSLTFDPNFGSTVDVTLSQNVIGTPEPASALLLLAGAGALAAFRKRRQATA